MIKKVAVYESIYLLQPNFTQQETASKMKYYQSLIAKHGSEVKMHNKGKRALSYPVKGFDYANYVQLIYEGNEKLVKAINLASGRDESVLRTLTTRLNSDLEEF